jgi:hypothetical protein
LGDQRSAFHWSGGRETRAVLPQQGLGGLKGQLGIACHRSSLEVRRQGAHHIGVHRHGASQTLGQNPADCVCAVWRGTRCASKACFNTIELAHSCSFRNCQAVGRNKSVLPGQGFGGADDLRVVGCVQIVSKGRGYLAQLPPAAARFQRL